MSEQLGSVGGGDVLSSIRRLVAEEKLPKRRQIRLAVAQPEVLAKVEVMPEIASDKLLLTPALRVEEPAVQVKATKRASKPRVVKAKEPKLVDAKAPDGPAVELVAVESKIEPVVTLISVSPPPESEPMVELMVTADPAQPMPQEPMDTMEAVIAALSQASAMEEAVAVVTQGVVVELSERRAERDEGPKAEPIPDLTAEDDAPILGMQADALRDLVREVLREELQGEFGERITRNVRKLVRAEIARALMSRGIE